MGALTLYGLGNIVGAGIYVLVGKVAGHAGLLAPVAFLLAAFVAGLTALSYAELTVRLPFAAGEPVYVQEAFGLRWLSVAVGLLIAFSGAVSSAALARGFAGYVGVVVPVPQVIGYVSLIIVLGALTGWGISQSVRTAVILTLVEIAGLLWVLWVVRDSFVQVAGQWEAFLPHFHLDEWQSVALGSVLAFYAFIGFEDMVKLSEEVKQPRRVLPPAIAIAVISATGLYLLIAVGVVLAVPVEALAKTDAPLALVYETVTGQRPVGIVAIGSVAAVNGVLAQIIMSSRVVYGMSRQGWLPAALGRVNPRTRTPVCATIVVTVAVLAFALLLPVETLAGVTSFMILAVFALANLALWQVKRVLPDGRAGRGLPLWYPLLALAAVLVLFVAGLMLFATSGHS